MHVMRERKRGRTIIVFKPNMTEDSAKDDIWIASKFFLSHRRRLWDFRKVAKPLDAFRPMNAMRLKRQVAKFRKFCPRMYDTYAISQYPNKLRVRK